MLKRSSLGTSDIQGCYSPKWTYVCEFNADMLKHPTLMICSMLGATYAKWDLGRNPARKTRPRFRTKKNSLILGGTKRAADLGRNGPRNLDLDGKKQPISGGTFREWDLGPKLKIHRFLMVFVKLIRGRSTRI